MREQWATISELVRMEVAELDAESVAILKNYLVHLIDMSGQCMNLAGLDGVTVASNYSKALTDLDRGVGAKGVLSPSDSYGVGIAMSPRVMRGGELKIHIVLNARTILDLLANGRRDLIVNTVAHECAHVELYKLFDIAFPGALLADQSNILDQFRSECAFACWNEFGACWRSASFGPSDPLAYEAAFLPALSAVRSASNSAIEQFAIDADVGEVVRTICTLYGELLTNSAYHLGNLHGLGIDWRTVPTTADALRGHWYLPFFERLDSACKAIAEDLGNWDSALPFEAIGDIAQDLLTDAGMAFVRHAGDRISVEFTPPLS